MSGSTSSLSAAVAAIVGLAVMFFGPLAFDTLPPQTVWTDEDAQAYSKAGADLHSATYGANHTHEPGHKHAIPAADDPALVAAREAFQVQAARLHKAQSRQVWMKWGIRVVGILLAGGGVVGYLLAQRTGDGDRD
ncbi:MAG: hypothetical protein SFU86_15770 [Pirellulaceae bacterium]|nr:hypothetical protein [Pirellulaceae bacterium]